MRRTHFSDKRNLTERHRQVLRLIAFGHSNKQIAEQLFLSVKTIEKHRNELYERLRVNCSMACARVAIRRGFIDVQEWLSSTVGENAHHGHFVSCQQIKPPSRRRPGTE